VHTKAIVVSFMNGDLRCFLVRIKRAKIGHNNGDS
jgi:hypothetical protein